MPEVSQSKILSKLKKSSKGKWSKSRKAEPKAGGQQLPAGIRNGVAKLSSWKMDLTKKGDPYFVITGIVVEPEECKGMRASVMHFINESEYATVEQNLERLSSDMQLLGIDTSDLEEDDIPKALEEAVEEGPHFYFNTTKRQNGETKVFIQGLAQDWDPEASEDDDDGSDSDDQDDDQDDDNTDDADSDDSDDSGDDDDSSDDDNWEPAKGETYGYKAKGSKKVVNFDVVKVNTKKETVELKEENGKKIVKDVPWKELQSAV